MAHISTLWQAILRQQPVFASAWNNRELEHAYNLLQSQLRRASLPKNGVIYATELEVDYVIIIEGIVALNKGEMNGSKYAFSRWLRPHILTAKSVLWSTAPDARFPDGFLQAITSTRYGTLNAADIEYLLQKSPVMCELLLGMFATALHMGTEDLYLRRQRLPVRMARLLVDLLEYENLNHCLTYSHWQLAPLIDTYRETITVTLQTLRDAGAITNQRGRIEVVNYDRLLEIAELRLPMVPEPFTG